MEVSCSPAHRDYCRQPDPWLCAGVGCSPGWPPWYPKKSVPLFWTAQQRPGNCHYITLTIIAVIFRLYRYHFRADPLTRSCEILFITAIIAEWSVLIPVPSGDLRGRGGSSRPKLRLRRLILEIIFSNPSG